ncbi:hypothetical protein EYZ11_010567 [Aspergillus tanneri]|uniref:Uncharacterized protein n=1 Tax=Aspergillus tanneri TaxID=1220188 RepID=A0A4S3J767_9EURO|nr:hypothetical protein EYZ11_010567 [Aspergillus tanneri]
MADTRTWAAEAGNGVAQPGNAAPDRPGPRRYKAIPHPPL